MPKYCTACGTEIKKGNLFCENCGAKLPVEKKPSRTSEPKEMPSKQDVQKKIRPSRKRFIIALISVFVVILLIGVVFATMDIKNLISSSTAKPQIITGVDGTQIEVPTGAVSSDAVFSITKLDTSTISQPEWANGMVWGYNYSCTQKLSDFVFIKIPLPSQGLCVIGHYTDDIWEIKNFTVENTMAIVKTKNLSDFVVFNIDFGKIINGYISHFLTLNIEGQYQTTEKLNVDESASLDMLKGVATLVGKNEAEFTITNIAPIPLDVFPLPTNSVQSKPINFFGSDQEQGNIIEPGSFGKWKSNFYPGNSLSFYGYFSLRAFMVLFIELLPIDGMRSVIESNVFWYNGKTVDINDAIDILLSVIIPGSEELKKLEPLVKLLQASKKIYDMVQFHLELTSADVADLAKISFSRSENWKNIANFNIMNKSSFARITFNTTDTASSELWVEAEGTMNKVLDFFGKNILTTHHDWEFGPLTPNTNYNFHLVAKGSGFRWTGTEEISGSFTTTSHPSSQQIGSGSDDILGTPQITYSYDMYSQYTVTIAFQTPDYSLCEVQYAGGMFINSVFSSTSAVMNTIMAKAETSASTSHSIALTYVVPYTKFFYCIFDCRPADAQPWEQQTKQLIYFGSFETPMPY